MRTIARPQSSRSRPVSVEPASCRQTEQKASIKQKASHLCNNQTLRVWKKHSFWKSDDNMNSSNGHNIMTLQSNDQQHADKQVEKASCLESNKPVC